MCMPGDNTDDDGRADPPHRHGRGPALRHPRGRPHRRRRPRHQDHQVASETAGAQHGQGEREAGRRSPSSAPTCKRRNYITMKNKLNDRERIEMKKYCRWDRHAHRSTRRPADASTSLTVDRVTSAPSTGRMPRCRPSWPSWSPPPRRATGRRSTSWCARPTPTPTPWPTGSPATRRTRATWCRRPTSGPTGA